MCCKTNPSVTIKFRQQSDYPTLLRRTWRQLAFVCHHDTSEGRGAEGGGGGETGGVEGQGRSVTSTNRFMPYKNKPGTHGSSSINYYLKETFLLYPRIEDACGQIISVYPFHDHVPSWWPRYATCVHVSLVMMLLHRCNRPDPTSG